MSYTCCDGCTTPTYCGITIEACHRDKYPGKQEPKRIGNMQRVHIKSDGDPRTTKIIDADTGKELTGITDVKLEIGVGTPMIAHITQMFQVINLDVKAEVKSIKVQPAKPDFEIKTEKPVPAFAEILPATREEAPAQVRDSMRKSAWPFPTGLFKSGKDDGSKGN